MLLAKVEEKIRALDIAEGKSVLLGLSGGPDSMALFHTLNRLREKYSFCLIPCHVNHMFRGEEADREESYLKKYGEEHGIVLETIKVDVGKIARKDKLSNQAAGHSVRKDFFRKMAKKHGAEYIFLAHHLDDRIESFFLHLLHGSGTQGLTALPELADYGDGLLLVRPFYDISKKEILKYCEEQDLYFFRDPSNEKRVYKRNKIRLDLLPYLESEYNPRVQETIARTIEILEDENGFLNQLTEKAYCESTRVESEGQALVLNRESFNNLDKALQRRVLIKIFDALEEKKIAYSFEKISKVLQLIKKERGQQYFKLSRESYMEVRYGEVWFCRGKLEEHLRESLAFATEASGENSPEKSIPVPLEDLSPVSVICLNLGEHSFEFSFAEEAEQLSAEAAGSSTEIIFLPYEQLKDTSLYIRTRWEGDLIRPSKGRSKKLKKYFIEKKLPRNERDKVVFLGTENEVIWIPGMTISEDYKVKEEKNEAKVEQGGKKLLKVSHAIKHSLKNG